MKQSKGSKVIITAIICATVTVILVVGSLIYMQKQNLAQKDKELQQQKQLKEYEQQQINKRQNKEQGSPHVDPCDRYSTC